MGTQENRDKESEIPRPSIESLSNLIFGLALSIGAIAILGKQASDIGQVLGSIVAFGFGFMILLNVWYRYSTMMKVLPIETSALVTLNLVLLFLVAVEPYLLNLITIGGSEYLAVFDAVSQIYAVDLGLMYLILAYFYHQIIVQERKLPHKTKLLKRADYQYAGFTARQFLWILFLPLGLIVRLARVLEDKSV